MKSLHHRWRPLLDDVLAGNETPSGPDCAAVLAMVRTAQAQRQQRRLLLSTAAVLALCFTYLSYQTNKPVPQPIQVAVRRTVEPALPPVKQINDDELLALLKDTPAALMEWPDGTRTLLIVQHK